MHRTPIFVRYGSAVLLSEFGQKPATVGDVVALGANTLCGSDPEGAITVTTLYLDRDYVIDQVFWQHAALLADRLRETNLPIGTAMREVGWNSRGHAARMFRQCVGVTPTRYRQKAAA